MWLFSDWVKAHKATSIFGIAAACFISNASVLLPSASLFTVIQAATIINPLAVGVAGGFGCACGEMTGYLFGNFAYKQIKSKQIIGILNKIKPYFEKHPYLLIAIFSVIPLPVFDLIGILSGSYSLNPAKFFAACFIGKAIKCTTFAFAASLFTSFF